ncbi:MAG: hypothetical protein AABZ08_13375 [Planctomycetota bacterium]
MPCVRLVTCITIFVLTIFTLGCAQPQAVIIDYSTVPMRFVIDHQGWPRPFKTPRVTEFAIANDQDELVWQLAATDGGADARGFAIVYGEPPRGFEQVFPEKSERPKPLVRGRTYFMAAGGKSAVYRMVFALPQDPLEVHLPRFPTSAPR